MDDIELDRTAEAISKLVHLGSSTATMAEAFGMPRRTMQRLLQQSGFGRLGDDERLSLIAYVHERRHDGMTIREIVADLADKHRSLRRSVGWVSIVLRQYRCEGCSNAPSDASEHPTMPDPDVQSRHMAQVNGGGRDG